VESNKVTKQDYFNRLPLPSAGKFILSVSDILLYNKDI
jgi:hypothetical protein